MPSPDVIRERIISLESAPFVTDPEPKIGELWEGREYGVRFEVFRGEGTVFGQREKTITVGLRRGSKRGKERLIQDFVNAFGREHLIRLSAERGKHPEVVVWRWQTITKS